MRILHVVPYYPPDRIGGVGEVVYHLHRGLLSAGHDSHVVTAGTTKDDPTVERIAETPLGWMIKVAGLARRASEFDAVHCHQGEAIALAVTMRALRVRTPLLTTFHMSFAELARGHHPYKIEGRLFGRSFRNLRYRLMGARIHQLTDRVFLWLADGSVFISRSSALDVLGVDLGRNATVIYNAVSPLGGDEDVRGSEKREGILYVGNPSSNKRSTVLPFVLRRVREQLPGTRLTMVGVEPAEAPTLVSVFQDLRQSDHVTWVGRVHAEQITELYRAACVVLVPSASEGLPMVILEALRCGTPCVATRVSGHPEVIEHGVNGFLVGVDEPGDMSRRCLEILTGEDLGEALGAAGRRIVKERFGVERQVEEYVELYQSLVRDLGVVEERG